MTSSSSTPTVNKNITFKATSTTTFLTLYITSGTVGYGVYWDSVSCRGGIPDRSVKGKGLAVHGTPTVSAVATGAELKCISGFTTSNSLQL